MKVEKHHSSYRVRKMVQGKTHYITYDHKPTQAEVMRDLLELEETVPVKGSFFACAESYIDSKSNVISPKTIRSYKSLLNASISKQFRALQIANITQQDIQLEVNRFAADHSPKSVRNLHGFISAVLSQFRPNMSISTTLPQKAKYEHYTPSEDDIKRILEASKDDAPNHICFQLGCMSLRRSEILALTLDDIDGNILTINKAVVQNSDGDWVIKSTKSTAGTRKIYIPDSLVEEIRELGYIYNRNPDKMRRALNRYQDKLGIPRFRFHDLRHFFASYAHEKGMSEQAIMDTGGWRSAETLRSVYRHSMGLQDAQKATFEDLIVGQNLGQNGYKKGL